MDLCGNVIDLNYSFYCYVKGVNLRDESELETYKFQFFNKLRTCQSVQWKDCVQMVTVRSGELYSWPVYTGCQRALVSLSPHLSHLPHT